MNRDTKKNLKIVADIYHEIVAFQVEDYCPASYRVIVLKKEFSEKK